MMKQVNIQIPARLIAVVCGLFLAMGAFAQITVKGHVKDSSGEPVIGATVRAAGQQGGTVSDFDGNFTLKAQQGATLEISYVGYQTARVAAAPSVVVTLLDDAQVLDNVVVIGYGRAKKSDLTGSVTAIKPDDKNHGLQVTATDMLQGKIAGVNVTSGGGRPGDDAQIRIRGGSSLTASNNPLIVIDGIAMASYGMQGGMSPLALVNPADIESFSVLKSASATAIYGSRASNGVIIITTKKGRKGQKPQLSYNANMSVSAPKGLLKTLDGNEYKDFVAGLYGTDSDAYKALGWYDNDGNQHFANTDWQDEIFRTAVSTDHNLSLSGATKNMPYHVSLGATSQNGILKTSNLTRYTAAVNLSPSFLNDHLNFNINGKGMYARERKADEGAIGNARYMDPTKPVKANNDIYNNFFAGYTQWYTTANYPGDTEWTHTNSDQGTSNPVAQLDLNRDIVRSKQFTGNVEADYAIHGFEDLHLHVNAGMSIYSGKENTDISPYSRSNNYFGYTSWTKYETYTKEISATAQYMKDLNEANHFDIMAGYEWKHYHESSNWEGWGTYPSTSPQAGQLYDKKPADGTTNRYKSENYLVSFFGRMNYSLLDRYMLTFTLRDDGSSRFAKGKKWGLFPAAAIAWKIKEEAFLKNSKLISDLKLRLDWGITGQQEGIGDYLSIASFVPTQDAHATYPLFGNGFIQKPTAYNKELTWETTTTYNVGIDMAFLNNRIELSADWYYRKTKDLIDEIYLPAGTTFETRFKYNAGELHNTGIEGNITVRPVVTKNWRWEVNYNVTYNQNEIDKTANPAGIDAMGISAGVGGFVGIHKEGNAVGSFNVFQQIYDQAGNPIANTFVDRYVSGNINNSDRYLYYKAAPDVTMGLSTKLQYKQWDLGASARANLGNYVYNDNLAGSIAVGPAHIYTVGFLGNRLRDAVRLGIQNPGSNMYFSDFFVTNGSFLKIDNITLGYSFEHLWDTKISGRVYGTVQNVYTWTKYEGVDPETKDGIDKSLYPRPITTIIGLNLNF